MSEQTTITKAKLEAMLKVLFGDQVEQFKDQASPASPTHQHDTTHAEPEPQPKPLQPTVDLVLKPSEMHKVVIVGRGEVKTRTSTLLRLRPDVMAEAKKLVDGPFYLIAEIALRRYIEELKKRPAGSVEMIRAEDLGSGSSGRVS